MTNRRWPRDIGIFDPEYPGFISHDTNSDGARAGRYDQTLALDDEVPDPPQLPPATEERLQRAWPLGNQSSIIFPPESLREEAEPSRVRQTPCDCLPRDHATAQTTTEHDLRLTTRQHPAPSTPPFTYAGDPSSSFINPRESSLRDTDGGSPGTPRVSTTSTVNHSQARMRATSEPAIISNSLRRALLTNPFESLGFLHLLIAIPAGHLDGGHPSPTTVEPTLISPSLLRATKLSVRGLVPEAAPKRAGAGRPLTTAETPSAAQDFPGVVNDRIPEEANESPYDQCAICFSDIVPGEIQRQLLQCQHVFHADCIDRWLCASNRCPACRNCLLEKPSTSELYSRLAAASAREGPTDE